MKNNSAEKVRMASLEDLLGGGYPPAEIVSSSTDSLQVVRVSLEKLHTFHSHANGHPFRVLDDEKMAETVASVKEYGVLVPGIVRPDKMFPGEYELISGHRRHRASELAGMDDMPVIIRDMTDAEATVIMVDANIQREDLLVSERAWAYRMRYEAMKELGTAETGIRKDEILAKEAGESRNSIQRYIRMTYLVPKLLQMVDDNKLPKIPAVELSYLLLQEQAQLCSVIAKLKTVPSLEQAQRLKEFSREGSLSPSVMEYVLSKSDDGVKVSLPAKKIRSYFPESYTGEQIQETIYRLLEEWKNSEEKKL